MLNKNDEKETLAETTIALLVSIGNAFLSAFTMKCLWNWFVAPVTNFTNIGLFQAMGLNMFLSYPFQYIAISMPRNEKLNSSLARSLVMTFAITLTLIVAYIVKGAI